MTKEEIINNMLNISNFKLLMKLLLGKIKNHQKIYLFSNGEMITCSVLKDPMEVLRAEIGHYRVFSIQTDCVMSIKRTLRLELNTRERTMIESLKNEATLPFRPITE